MGQPAAAQGDQVTGVDIHLGTDPSGVTTPMSTPFQGVLSDGLSSDVRIQGRPAAVVGSGANNQPPHVPLPPAVTFPRPPTNRGTVQAGSATVRINGRFAARAGDPVLTCNDPVDAPVATVVAAGPVRIG